MVVGAEARGSGVGTALVRHVEEFARSRECERIEVTSAERRADAHRFYLARGYEFQGRRFIKSM